MTNIFCSLANAMMGSISHGHPARCTQIMAFVRGDNTARIVPAVMFWLSSSTSAKIGVAPANTMQETDAIKVREVTITSSSGPISSAFSATA